MRNKVRQIDRRSATVMMHLHLKGGQLSQEQDRKQHRARRLAETLVRQNCHEHIFEVELLDRSEVELVRDEMGHLGYRAEIVDPGNRLKVYC
jgi:hypothetical protein